MPTLAVTRCARPVVRTTSTYTVLGFAGYGAASLVAAALFIAWDLPLADRLVAAFAPPLAFLLVVNIAHAIIGVERIVFFQTAVTGVVAAISIDALAGSNPARVADIATIGVGTFLVFGRLGCFAVACCHGRPARVGVVYGPDHVRAGFWARWQGRRLWPTQLVESATSLVLVVVGLAAGWNDPGLPAVIYITSYSLVRFALELVRGDAFRPYRLGLSEAQWTSPMTALACAIGRPSVATIAVATVLVIAATVLVLRRNHRELFAAPHLAELDRACRNTERSETSLGVSISRHDLPDGRIDWVLSSTHPAWSPASVRRLADLMWERYELVDGRTPGLVHIIEAAKLSA
ncbi:MAG TPA: prolipoprotein diacylglyceryl transferase family protein [Kofleriaceae bacterium]|nr:prolipoprotein diacylglyceryl transferase family protein [Kofleriaceae bacterium]